MASPSEELPDREEPPATKEMVYKMKLIQFLGRTTPIILQNDNGPCPLLAICNLLLLRNNLNLSSDVTEVSQEKLLSLVAERLIDSNSNVNNKDAGYVENQQQNIADAIDLLPRLATGIDVNIKFTTINDFEFTRECAIFDLLDIPLYHGWIVDPQDSETANAIGLKSYNTLMGELVALETQDPTSVFKNSPEEDCVDVVAATSASLEVRSADDSPHTASNEQVERKTDTKEEEELLRALKLSETVNPSSANDSHVINDETSSENSNVAYLGKHDTNLLGDTLEVHTDDGFHKSHQQEPSANDDSRVKNDYSDDLITFEDASSSKAEKESQNDSKDAIENTSVDTLVKTQNTFVHSSREDEKIPDQSILNADINEVGKINLGDGISHESCSSAQNSDESKSLSSSADGKNEPVYEQEKCISETATTNRERICEGEVSTVADGSRPKDGTTAREGELITNFLKNSASQLTIYGLFSLQDGLKERELCVFFRNNHFNTMFKFEGEVYILATDQGYINQPDLVWEKLNEVNGNTVFVTNNFKEFKAENDDTHSWDEQNARANTVDYLATIDNTVQANTSFNSDLQLAIALQQQEFEQQQQPSRVLPQSPTVARSGLVVGPQHVHPLRPRNSSSQQEPKPSKDKCTVM